MLFCERSFGELELIKKLFKLGIGQEILSNMVVLSIENDLDQPADTENIIDEFVSF